MSTRQIDAEKLKAPNSTIKIDGVEFSYI